MLCSEHKLNLSGPHQIRWVERNSLDPGACTHSKQIIWFLVPTVALAEQQFKVLEAQIPSVQIKQLVGADGVDTWSDTRIWNDYLENVRIVVSTYQVLSDAISHAFVPLSRLCLIVIDEGKQSSPLGTR